MSSFPPFLSLASCCVLFPFTGTFKVSYNVRMVQVQSARIHGLAWNTGTCMFMVWTALGCLTSCINSIVWNKNVINRAPVYCDIGKTLMGCSSKRSLTDSTVTRIQAGLNVAMPACSLCINRRLYKIASSNPVMATREEKRRAVVVDLLICLGIPILGMVARKCAQ
jgi:pheromone a factor receptor